MMGNSIAYNIGRDIERSLKEWEKTFKFGCNDPLWEDGCNLNLLRNHIIYYKKRCDEELLPEDYPEQYYCQLPPKVDEKYMAAKDEIRTSAVASLFSYTENQDYQYLLRNVEKLDEKQKAQTHIENVIGYVSGLRTFIEHDDLVAMRRHRDAERYCMAFAECRRKVEEMVDTEKAMPTGQLSIFDLFEM